MSSYLTFTIGSAEASDIRLNQASIAARHAELVIAASGKIHLTDCGSDFGTYRKQGNDWAQVAQSYVESDAPIRFGEYHTTVQALLGIVAPNGVAALMQGRSGGVTAVANGSGNTGYDPKEALPTGRVRRAVDTGEIIAVKED